MMEEVRRSPTAKTLEDLKDCLDFCSTSWTALFCRLGGAPLLLQVCLRCSTSTQAMLVWSIEWNVDAEGS